MGVGCSVVGCLAVSRCSRKREGIQRKIDAARRLPSARKGENVVRANYPLARECAEESGGARKKKREREESTERKCKRDVRRSYRTNSPLRYVSHLSSASATTSSVSVVLLRQPVHHGSHYLN